MYSFSLITLEDLQQIEYSSKFPGTQTSWISDWYHTFKKHNDNHFGLDKKAYILTAYEGNKLVAIVPLLRLTRTYFKYFKLQFLEFLGQQWSGMGHDIIVIRELEAGFVEELFYWIKRNISYHFIFLKYLPSGSSLKSKFRFYRYAGAPFVQTSSFSDYERFRLKVYSRKFREDLRRTYRRIKRDGFKMEVEQHEINEYSLAAIRNISASKTTDGKSDLYENKLKEDFHLKIYRQNPSKVVFIKFNGEAVAYGTLIDINGQRIGVDSAFDRKFRKYGVGIHCIDQIIRDGFDDKVQKLSFGLGMDTYKFQFTNCIEEFFMCYDFKIRLKSLFVLPYFHYRIKKMNQDVSAVMERNKQQAKPGSENDKTSNDKFNFVESVEI
ncbi:GNAT family N-acetyltransferase [Marinifilum sp. D737]|uniref:GNAT family N-acetyltransferase n=1 Tax=Marinifilum sp. D737 TaxID=2969628 RepID=UPI002273EEEB|nr:GNAT family N-acetyltransferase [Marinifilum sp. D737]MCY1633405.1 GNAT family N-acetyltransferase [Marinifilum sp. D737]